MADNITRASYRKEIRDLASNILEEVFTDDPDQSDSDFDEAVRERVWETADGHQWIIYYHYNIEVLRYSDNDDALFMMYGPQSFDGYQDALMKMANAAFYEDLSEAVGDPSEYYSDHSGADWG